MAWVKSTKCDNGSCLEVDMDWAKSSRCDGSNCLEAGFQRAGACDANGCLEAAYQSASKCQEFACLEACHQHGQVLVRNNTYLPDVLALPPDAWQAMVNELKEKP